MTTALAVLRCFGSVELAWLEDFAGASEGATGFDRRLYAVSAPFGESDAA
ncbi:MAG: hypothetical protein QOK34_1596 [Gaiellaceae bacterium]|jgi:hypothetical protein|nr:hypothetical protein [Gaiellaceae bacterium]